jgi:hypothetical protein
MSEAYKPRPKSLDRAALDAVASQKLGVETFEGIPKIQLAQEINTAYLTEINNNPELGDQDRYKALSERLDAVAADPNDSSVYKIAVSDQMVRDMAIAEAFHRSTQSQSPAAS